MRFIWVYFNKISRKRGSQIKGLCYILCRMLQPVIMNITITLVSQHNIVKCKLLWVLKSLVIYLFHSASIFSQEVLVIKSQSTYQYFWHKEGEEMWNDTFLLWLTGCQLLSSGYSFIVWFLYPKVNNYPYRQIFVDRKGWRGCVIQNLKNKKKKTDQTSHCALQDPPLQW